MAIESNDAAYVWDMLQACRGVVRSLADLTLDQYRNDDNLKLATERRIEIIGEAANRVSPTVRDAHTQVPWRRIIAQRHVLAHDYGEIDDELIWSVATTHIPQLIPILEGMIPDPADSETPPR
jgi:uncharacterized protein with HEPN domain